MGSPTQNLGTWGEYIAAKYLESRGFFILKKHFTSRFGEIDIIAKEKSQIVFVEVRTRLKSLAGIPENTIDAAKQRKLQKTISAYVSLKGLENFRIDVVSISPGSREKTIKIRHHRSAFEAMCF